MQPLLDNPDPIELLGMHHTTRGLSEAQIQQLAEQSEVIRADAGRVLQAPDSETDSLLLIIAGQVSLALVLPSGEEHVIFSCGRDEHVGIMSVLQDDPFPVRLVAEQQSLLVRIPRDATLQLMEDLPLWSRHLLQTLTPKIRDKFLNKKHRNRPWIVVFVHTSEQSRQLTELLTERLASLGENIGLMSDCETTLQYKSARSESVFGHNGKLRSPEEFRKVIGEWSEADRVILDAHQNTTLSELKHLMAGCDRVYWFCQPDTIRTAVDQLESLVDESPNFREKVSFVHVLDTHQQIAPGATEIADVCHRDFKLHWNDCDQCNSTVCSRNAGIERIIHDLRGVSVGLALGGGAARGMAHLGVLQVIEKAGITIDRLSGTSAGALTGIMYAAGHSADYCIERFATDLTPGWFYRLLPYGDALFVLLKYRLNGWDQMLRNYLGDWRLEQLTLPFSSVTADLISAKTVVRQTGDATHALLESINLPGIAKPICLDGMALVDGGILNVVPANILVDQGANLIVSSDVSANISFEFAGNRPDTPTDQMNRSSGMASLFRMRTVQDRNIRTIGGSVADIVIEPDISSVQVTDFKNAPRIAKLGRDAAEAALPKLKRVLNEIDPQLFPL